jgi:hypothetical protein
LESLKSLTPFSLQALPFAFSRAIPEGVSVSADGLAVSRVGIEWNDNLLGALVEPAFSSAERCYAEWVIEEADADCRILIGVTDLDAAPPAGQCMRDMPGSRMYSCRTSNLWPGGRDWGATGQRARGDRVGLLVERGGVSVYVNGARLGPGPMATDLPQRVRLTARISSSHQCMCSLGRWRRTCQSGRAQCALAAVHKCTMQLLTPTRAQFAAAPAHAYTQSTTSTSALILITFSCINVQLVCAGCIRCTSCSSACSIGCHSCPCAIASPVGCCRCRLTTPHPQVRFAVEMHLPGTTLRLVPGAAPPGA